MAEVDARDTAKLERMLEEDGQFDQLRELVREAVEADTPVERALTLRSAADQAATINRALRRAAISARDEHTRSQMGGG